MTPPLKNPGYAPDNAVKAFEYAVREKCFKSQFLEISQIKSVTKSSFSEHCIQIIHLIRRRVTKTTLKHFSFPVAYPEGDAEASGLRPQTYPPNRPEYYLNFPYNFPPTA